MKKFKYGVITLALFLSESPAAETLPGEEVYNAACLSCHAVGAAGAPRFRKKEDWAPLIAQGMDVVYANAIMGIGAHPARGLCGNCSDTEIIEATDYMIIGLAPEK